MEYFFLGDEELAIAFRLIGINGKSVDDADEAALMFKAITEGADPEKLSALNAGALPEPDSCRVLLLTEETADWLGDLLVNWQLSGRYPLVVEIPGILGRLEGRQTLVDAIREAIGIHV